MKDLWTGVGLTLVRADLVASDLQHVPLIHSCSILRFLPAIRFWDSLIYSAKPKCLILAIQVSYQSIHSSST